ncbi:hypothetical protein [Nonomuraea rhodomycinica]|nr:hypothetical protein [Nonomuraea rhodomycinica]
MRVRMGVLVVADVVLTRQVSVVTPDVVLDVSWVATAGMRCSRGC